MPSAEQTKTKSFSPIYEQMKTEYGDILTSTSNSDDVKKTVDDVTDYISGQGTFLDKAVDTLASFFGSEVTYAVGYEDTIRQTIKDGVTLGNVLSLLVEGIPALAILHPIITGQVLANKDDIAQAHYPELCLAWMNTLSGANGFVDNRTRQLKINCPVNIEVYDSSNILVAQIIGNTVIDVENSTIAAYIDENDQKVIILPIDEEYSIQLVATDEGTVTYTATEYNIDTGNSERVVSYYEIEVEENDELVGVVENLNEKTAKYPLTLNGTELEATIDQSGSAVIEYTVTATVSGNGSAFGGGSYVSGEFAKVIAEANSGEEFLGWYINNQLVSSELEYRFLVDGGDVEAIARFTTNTNQSSSGSGGGSGGNYIPSNPSYQITISTASNGTVAVTPTSAILGDQVTITASPDNGYQVGDVTVTDSSGEGISVIDDGDGTYTFVMPASQVTISVTFEWVNPFADVFEDNWFYDEVAYVAQNGLMMGTSDTTFAPNSMTTRAMIVTILYRLEGFPVAGSVSFDDVKAGTWYTDAIAWASANGIVDGYGNGKFGPDDPVTREQMAAILYHYADYKGYDVSGMADLTGYTDANAVSDWALTAMRWANDEGLITGRTAITLVPNGTATRSEVAAILMRICQNVAGLE